MKLKEKDIIASRYVYGDEVLLYKFFEVVKATDSSVVLRELEKEVTYDDGLEEPHYYDAPKHCFPIFGSYVGDAFRRKVKYVGDTPIIKTDEFWTSRGVWNGRPLEEYNLH